MAFSFKQRLMLSAIDSIHYGLRPMAYGLLF